MDKNYNHQTTEKRIYEMWEKGGYFTPKIDKSKKPARNASANIAVEADAGGPFTIILPLPNANDPMHMGHTLFTVEDILIRYHRMLGEPTLWLPGADHAGIETQFVFEKYLAKEGKSRFDFDQKTLYQMIWDFVEKNREINRDQMKRLGFSLDWSRYHYSLEPEIIKRVLQTFINLYKDGLAYRDNAMINFCPKCGTAFSDLEVDKIERVDPLYYVKYAKAYGSGFVTVATTRPEPIFADTHLAVNPHDKKNSHLLGTKVLNPLTNKSMEIIADDFVDLKFGTGIVKLTPAHDFADFEVAKKHNLPIITAITSEGKIAPAGGKYAALKIKAAREQIVLDLQQKGLIEKIDENYSHVIGVCYRCKTTIEPRVINQWFIKTKPLAKLAIDAVKKGKTIIVPNQRFERLYFDWLENIRDWNISRQIVWGVKIPAWYCVKCNKTFVTEEKPAKCDSCGSTQFTAETDTFDTWFLSGQWPVNTLKSKSGDFEYFYPTSVLDTLWDILFFWVVRMMMLGIYLTGEVPFKVIHLHSRVIDKEGKKMSKSKGNVLNPIEMVDKYGADALRMALIIGIAPASDIAISEDKIRAMRNFTNKIWNIGRFILLNLETLAPGESVSWYEEKMKGLNPDDLSILSNLRYLIKKTTDNLDNYRFGSAAEDLYEFLWHEFADHYIENCKLKIENSKTEEEKQTCLSVSRHVYLTCLKLLHPFMPYITEELWQMFPRQKSEPLIISKWPKNTR